MGISLRWGARATAGVHDMQRARAQKLSCEARHYRRGRSKTLRPGGTRTAGPA